MSLVQIISAISTGGGVPPPAPPFDDTIVFNIDSIQDNDPDYYFSGDLLQNPTNGNIIETFNNGDEHVWTFNKKASARKSTDLGVSFGSVFDLYDPVDGGIYGNAGGYSDNGRYHLFAPVREGNLIGDLNELRYLYSDDGGATFSTPVALSLPADGMYGSWVATGTMIENNGVLLKTFYRINAPSDPSMSVNYILRSTDGGANWTAHVVRAIGSAYYNEMTVIAISSTELITIIRDETLAGWRQFYSDDNGLTWVEHGAISFNEFPTVGRPGSLRKFDINGQRVISFYSFNNSTGRTFVVYAKASDLSSGTSAWNLNTKVQLLTGGGQGGYGQCVYFDNTLRAIGTHYIHSVSSTSSVYMTLPTTQYQNIITELGL